MGNAVTKIHYELTKEADFVLSVYYIKAISPCKMTKEVNNWSKTHYGAKFYNYKLSKK